MTIEEIARIGFDVYADDPEALFPLWVLAAAAIVEAARNGSPAYRVHRFLGASATPPFRFEEFARIGHDAYRAGLLLAEWRDQPVAIRTKWAAAAVAMIAADKADAPSLYLSYP